MKFLLPVIAASLALGAAPAMAADEAPTFEKGPVWDYAEVRTVDGHFDEYMKWLSTDWKAQEEAQKKAGYIVDYKVFVVADPRDNEPDVILATEYKDMAAEFDHPVAEEFAFGQKLYGSIAKANQQQADRSTIRKVLGDVVVREMILK